MRGWLTPDNDDGQLYVLLSIPKTVEWIACLRGAILSLTYDYNWEQYGTMTPEETAAKWLEIFNAIVTFEGDMLADIQFNENMLQKKFINSDTWVDVGEVMRHAIRVQNGAVQYDLNGDNIYEFTQYINPNTGNYVNGLAPITDTDKLCYTAQKLAEDVLDDFQDMLQVLDYNTTVISSTVTQVADKLFSSLPGQIATFETGLVIAAGLQILYQISDATLDYIIVQAGDVDVKNRVAEFIFCALKDSLVEGSDGVVTLVNFEANLISRIGTWYFDILTFGSYDIGYEMDFGDAFEDLFGAINAAIAGLACSYALAEVALLDPLGLKDNWKSVILGYQQQAEFFDSRDCEDYDCNKWCYEWNFLETNGGFAVLSPSASSKGVWTVSVGWQSQGWNSPTSNRNLNAGKTFSSAITVTKVQMVYTVTDLGNPDSMGNFTICGGEFSGSIGEHDQTVNVTFTGTTVAMNMNSVRRDVIVFKLVFFGTGELPDELTGGEQC